MGKQRDYIFFGLTNSLCSRCLSKVEAKILFRGDRVLLQKHCPDHGMEEVLIADDRDYYQRSLLSLKPGDMPLRFNTPLRHGCPYDCGLCPDHEQHSCLTVVEITDRCNLACPICYADSGPEPTYEGRSRRHRSLQEIEAMLDAVVANEGEAQIVQLSGGEPTLHPQFWEIMDLAKTKAIKHLMINTNGIRLAQEPDFVKRLARYLPGIEVYLQFDSLQGDPLQVLRGEDLREIRQRAIAHLNQYNLSTTLVVTVKKGLNDGEMGAIIDYALQQRSVRGVTFQPIQGAGRLDDFDPGRDRLTLTEVRRGILNQHSLFKPEDIVPVPCHPDCLAMGYALKYQGEVIPLTGLISPQEWVTLAPNSIVYEQDAQLRAKFRDLFSTSHSPKSAANSLQQLLCCLPQIPVPLGMGYDNIFRVLIIQFLDPYNFDVRSVKRSCIHIAHPDGRIIPFDTYNIFYREGSQGAAKLAQVQGART